MSGYTVSVEDAMARLDVIPDYDPGDGPQPCVHTFAQAAFGLLGAHWDLPSVYAWFVAHGVEESGETATAMGHGLVSMGDGRTLFFATRKREPQKDAA